MAIIPVPSGDGAQGPTDPVVRGGRRRDDGGELGLSLHPGAEDRRLPPRHSQYRPAPTALLSRGLEKRIQRRLSQELGQVGHRPVKRNGSRDA